MSSTSKGAAFLAFGAGFLDLAPLIRIAATCRVASWSRSSSPCPSHPGRVSREQFTIASQRRGAQLSRLGGESIARRFTPRACSARISSKVSCRSHGDRLAHRSIFGYRIGRLIPLRSPTPPAPGFVFSGGHHRITRPPAVRKSCGSGGSACFWPTYRGRVARRSVSGPPFCKPDRRQLRPVWLASWTSREVMLGEVGCGFMAS